MLQPLKKHRNYCPFCVPELQGRKLVKWKKLLDSRQFHEKFRNFMKSIENDGNLSFSAIRNPSRHLGFPQEKARVEELGTPGTAKDLKLTKSPDISWNLVEVQMNSLNSMIFKGNHRKSIFLFVYIIQGHHPRCRPSHTPSVDDHPLSSHHLHLTTKPDRHTLA